MMQPLSPAHKPLWVTRGLGRERKVSARSGWRKGGGVGVGWLKGKQERGSSLERTPFLLLG